jgi:hypothetical protein
VKRGREIYGIKEIGYKVWISKGVSIISSR